LYFSLVSNSWKGNSYDATSHIDFLTNKKTEDRNLNDNYLLN